MTTASEIISRRAASAAASTINEADRSVEVVWTSEHPVKRRSWEEGDFMEVLVVDPKAIRMDRFKAGMSLLDSHDNWSMKSRLGTVDPESVRLEGRTGIARVRFSTGEDAEVIWRDLLAGHPIQISVGYKIHKFEKTEGADGALPTLRAIDWEPMELSVVPIPADPNAFSRSLERTPEMTEQNDTQTRAERKRVSDITALARSAKIDLGDEMVTKAIEDGQTVESFRSTMLDHLILKEERAPTFPHSEMRGMGGNRSMSEAVADALMTRMDARHKPQNDAREFVGLTLPEIARRCLEARGESTIGMSPAGLITRSLHSTSDFPLILADVANKRLQTEFAAVPSALKRVAKQSSARDFRAKTVAKLGSAPELLPVTEAGEYKRGTMVEAAESYRIGTFGRIFGVTRQLLVNDDLGAFASAVTKLGQAAAVFEAKTLAELLASNPVMSDGKTLFHADHNNVAGSGTALDETTLSHARFVFRGQVGLASDLVNLAPKFLIVSAELETPAEKLLTAINATKTADVNPFSSQLELVVEPRLTGKAWYLAADPATCEGLEFSYLDGFEGPYTETRQGFDTDGVEFKVRLDFGAAFLEHRSWYKNPGV